MPLDDGFGALDKLLPHKEALEMRVKNWLGELFALKYDLLLYDVTTLEEIVETMEGRYGKTDRIWVGERIEKELQKIQANCDQRKWKKEVIDRRVGRVLGRHSRAAGLFEAEVAEEPGGGASITWEEKQAWRGWATSQRHFDRSSEQP